MTKIFNTLIKTFHDGDLDKAREYTIKLADTLSVKQLVRVKWCTVGATGGFREDPYLSIGPEDMLIFDTVVFCVGFSSDPMSFDAFMARVNKDINRILPWLELNKNVLVADKLRIVVDVACFEKVIPNAQNVDESFEAVKRQLVDTLSSLLRDFSSVHQAIFRVL